MSSPSYLQSYHPVFIGDPPLYVSVISFVPSPLVQCLPSLLRVHLVVACLAQRDAVLRIVSKLRIFFSRFYVVDDVPAHVLAILNA